MGENIHFLTLLAIRLFFKFTQIPLAAEWFISTLEEEFLITAPQSQMCFGI